MLVISVLASDCCSYFSVFQVLSLFFLCKIFLLQILTDNSDAINRGGSKLGLGRPPIQNLAPCTPQMKFTTPTF